MDRPVFILTEEEVEDLRILAKGILRSLPGKDASIGLLHEKRRKRAKKVPRRKRKPNDEVGDRNGVRTPMQWSPDRNGGFSRCDPARLYAPLIMDPVYGYESVNVEAQSRSLSSLLSATKRLISVRKSTLAFGRGTMTFIRPANRSVLAYVRQYRDEVILCVANLSRAAQATELDLSPWKDRIPQEMLGRTRFPEGLDSAITASIMAAGIEYIICKPADIEERPYIRRYLKELLIEHQTLRVYRADIP